MYTVPDLCIGCPTVECLQTAEMCSAPDDYHIIVPPLYEHLEDEKYQPFPPPLSPVWIQLSGDDPGTSSRSLEKGRFIFNLLVSCNSRFMTNGYKQEVVENVYLRDIWSEKLMHGSKTVTT